MNEDDTARCVILVSPRGFCAGVSRAIQMAEQLLDQCDETVYCLHEIVHNDIVVGRLAGRGMRFVKTLDAVPDGAALLLSAHGVPPSVHEQAGSRGIRVIDATCPFVDKVHREVLRSVAAGCSVLLIGKAGHQEVIGVVGEAPNSVQVVSTIAEAESVQVSNPDRVALVSQTTLSVEDCECVAAVLRRRFPSIQAQRNGDICYATRNRQKAVRALAAVSDVVLVFGAHNSSNSNRLVEVAISAGTPAHLVGSRDELLALDLQTAVRIGVASGASTPESFVQDMVAELAKGGNGRVETYEVLQERVQLSTPSLDV